MMNYFIDFVTKTIPSALVYGYSALKSYITGEKTVKAAAADFTGAYMQNAALEVGKIALTAGLSHAIPGFKQAKAVADTTMNIAATGISAATRGESVPKSIVKGAIGATNVALMGPVLAFPATMATDYIVDKAVDVYKVGPTTAWNNYRNAKQYPVIPYCDHGPALESDRYVDDELGMSFVNYRPAASAA